MPKGGMTPHYSDPLVTLYLGDCLDVMRELPDESVDAIVTDPPYNLAFMGKEWDRNLNHGPWATEAFRVAKPGAHILAFGGSRTVHRLASAIEDAGWEIRDELVWIYASGFPKSLDVSKAIDKAAGAEREVVGLNTSSRIAKASDERNFHQGKRDKLYGAETGYDITAPATPDAQKWNGWHTALKPAHEPIVMARKPLRGTVAANVLAYGTGAINVDGTRIGTTDELSLHGRKPTVNGWDPRMSGGQEKGQSEGQKLGRWPSNILLSDPELFDQPNPYVVGSGATQQSPADYNRSVSADGGVTGWNTEQEVERVPGYGDSGGYSRFFIIPKADRAERERGLAGAQPSESMYRGLPDPRMDRPQERTARANSHPTVKPIDLMRHLVRLVTPPGGVCLDPFLGSGTTALAASEEGFRCIGIEREAEYLEIATARIIATPMGLGLDVPAPTEKRSRSTGHWPKDRTPGKDGWGFSGQQGLDERYDKPEEAA